jgi:hypothetical protein
MPDAVTSINERNHQGQDADQDIGQRTRNGEPKRNISAALRFSSTLLSQAFADRHFGKSRHFMRVISGRIADQS